MFQSLKSKATKTLSNYQDKISVFYLLIAIIVYALWAAVGLFMPEFYYDRPLERLLYQLSE